VSFRELKAQIYWPTTDQKVRGSNPCGRTIDYIFIYSFWIVQIWPNPNRLEISFFNFKGRNLPSGSLEIGKLSIKLGGPQPVNEIFTLSGKLIFSLNQVYHY